MKRRVMILAVLICAAFLITMAIQYTTHAQESTQSAEQRPGGRPGGGPGGGRMGQNAGQFAVRMLPLEATWAQVSLEMDLTDEALVKARAIYKKAWKDRKGLIKTMQDAGGDREAMRNARSTAENIQAEIATKLADVLTPKQMEWLKDYEEKYREQSRQSFGGGRPQRNRQQRGEMQPQSEEQ